MRARARFDLRTLPVQLNHLDLQAPDVQRLAGFLVDHFDLERRSNDSSPAIAILGDRCGFTLVIQRRQDDQPYPAGFHIGFILPAAAEVRAQHTRMAAAGVTVGPIDVNARGTRFYLTAPGEILVEVSSTDRG
jgi:catechol 2,3-dioxygenase-like lactoylglutathione lyase family enzyme